MILEKLECIIKIKIENLDRIINPISKNQTLIDYRFGQKDALKGVLTDIAHLMNEEVKQDVLIIELKAQVERLTSELNNLKNGQNVIPLSNGKTYIQNKD